MKPDVSAPTPAVAETPPVALASVLLSKLPETPADASALTDAPTLPSAVTAVFVTSAPADAPASAPTDAPTSAVTPPTVVLAPASAPTDAPASAETSRP